MLDKVTWFLLGMVIVHLLYRHAGSDVASLVAFGAAVVGLVLNTLDIYRTWQHGKVSHA